MAVVAAVCATGLPSPVHAACTGDITGNYKVDVNDLAQVLAAWGQCTGACPADIAPAGGDGVVNAADLGALLGAWGNCPCTPATNCVTVTPLWCEDWSLNNYSRWTEGYSAPSSCESIAFMTNKFVTPVRSHQSKVLCATADSHRGYGGLRFQGNIVLPSFSTPSTGGINAPNGVIITFWSWLKVPYTFNSNKWISFMTVTNDCSNDWTDVITLNIDDSSMRVKPVHVSTVTYAANAPAMPLQTWVRTTVYLNYATGVMHVWQNGVKVVSATFTRPVSTMCQWHWGLYASAPNDDVVLYEEDLSIVTLTQPMTNFTLEPWFTPSTACATLP